jgi:carboxymethylenebutenolidase
MTTLIDFQAPNGRPCRGYLAEPTGANAGPNGLVVIQEWWGLNEQIRGVAERLAQAGYRVLVPDLYRGKTTVATAEAEHLMQGLDFLDAADQDIRGAVIRLQQQCAKVGIIGFCMGGALTVLSAMRVPEADAACTWYGIPPEAAGDVGTISIPLQGHFAQNDAFFPLSDVLAMAARLEAAGVDHAFFQYPAAHAFGNETGPNYNPTAAALAWQRSLDFFATTLKQ